MFNTKPSELIAVLHTIDPVEQAPGTIITPWVEMPSFHTLLVMIQTGVLAADATVNAKLEQATDASGSNTKDIVGKAITQIEQEDNGSNRQVLIDLRGEDLDTANDFVFVRLLLTVAQASGLVAAQLLGVNPRYAPASQPVVTEIV